MPQKTAGSLAICDAMGSLEDPVPGACVTATNCSIEQINAVVDNLPKALPNNCLDQMQDGDICGWQCPASHDNVGGWRCQYGEFVGIPGCLPRAGDVQATDVTVVAMEMQADITSTSGQDGWATTMSDALSQVLGAQIAYVSVTNEAETIVSGSGGRRLSMIEADHSLHGGRRLQNTYKIFFEAVILSTSTVRAHTVAQKALALTGSAAPAEQTSFIMQMANTGITVGSITLLMAPRTFQMKVPITSGGVVTSIWDLPVPDPDPVVVGGGTTATESADLGPIIGIVFGGLVGVGCCMGLCYCYWLIGKRFNES